MTPVLSSASTPAVLYDIDWRVYTRLLRAFEGERRFRLTYDRGTLEGRAYQVRSHSLVFPQLASADLVPFLQQQGQTDDTSIICQFREWVRQHLLNSPASPPAP
jgi:hypothetical protein